MRYPDIDHVTTLKLLIPELIHRFLTLPLPSVVDFSQTEERGLKSGDVRLKRRRDVVPETGIS